MSLCGLGLHSFRILMVSVRMRYRGVRPQEFMNRAFCKSISMDSFGLVQGYLSIVAIILKSTQAGC